MIIDCKSVISIMLIIPKDVLFKHVTVNNVQFVSDRKPFLIIKWEEFPVLIVLHTSADFNQIINQFAVSDNLFQNLSRFPALL